MLSRLIALTLVLAATACAAPTGPEILPTPNGTVSTTPTPTPAPTPTPTCPPREPDLRTRLSGQSYCPQPGS